MHGILYLYAEVDTFAMVTALTHAYFDQTLKDQSEKKMVGIYIWRPAEPPQSAAAQRAIAHQPKLFPLLLLDWAWMTAPTPDYQPWRQLGTLPSYIMTPSEFDGEIDSKLSDCLLRFASEWDEAWQRVRPSTGGTTRVSDGFSVSANGLGPLVIGWRAIHYLD